MAEKSEKVNHQNEQHAIGDDPKQERQKGNVNEIEAIAKAQDEPNSITNIYYDCLERICWT